MPDAVKVFWQRMQEETATVTTLWIRPSVFEPPLYLVPGNVTMPLNHTVHFETRDLVFVQRQKATEYFVGVAARQRCG